MANVFSRAIYSFYQSHSTILYNYNIYRCSSVCLFTSNDGGELWQEHRMNAFMQVPETKQSTFHWPVFNLLIGLAYRNAFVLISHWAPWHKHDSSSSLYSRGTDRIAKYSQAKASKNGHILPSFTLNINTATLPALSDRYAVCNWKKADFKHGQVWTPRVWKWAEWDANWSRLSFTCGAKAVCIQTFHSDSFVFHNTHPIIEKIKYANLGT